MEWLDGHGYGDLVTYAIAVINGVSKRSMTHVEQAELVVRGRCRAIVRVPWDDHLGDPGRAAAGAGPAWHRGGVPVRAAAAAGAARLHRAGRGAGLGARGRARPAARGGHVSSPDPGPVAAVPALLRRPDPADRDARLGLLPAAHPAL